nr:RHS repeat-associated core domain-containing protein [uncultured Undibacterium sp.]
MLGNYSNNHLGLRVEKEAKDPLQPNAPPAIFRTLWNGRHAFQDSDLSGNTLSRYENDGRHTVSFWSSTDGSQALHHDALGSITATTDNSGQLKSETVYDAFGNVASRSGLSANKFGYTGHQMDQETGLIYFQARYYDPQTGRFITQDPYEGDWNTPLFLHHYLYAYGNPTVYVDLDGYKSIFGDATNQIEDFKNWLGEKNKQSNSRLAAVAIGTSQFVATLGQALTGGLDIAANLAQTATGVDDQQVRDELGSIKRAVVGGVDFVVNGDYAQAAKKVYQNTVTETSKAIDGDVTATANLTQTVWGVLTGKSVANNAPSVSQTVRKTVAAVRDAAQSTSNKVKGLLTHEGAQKELSATATPAVQKSVVAEISTGGANSTVEATPMAGLQAKWGHLSASERAVLLDSKAEANAFRRLTEMEQGTPKAHYLEKHGAQLDLQSQFDRAAYGINPTTGQVQFAPPAATRFLSNRDQLNVINRAENIFQLTGDITQAQLPIRFNSVIGSGYQRGTLNYGVQYSGQVYLNSAGKAVTAFPVWGK